MMPRGKYWDILFVLLMFFLLWLVFGGGRQYLDMTIGF